MVKKTLAYNDDSIDELDGLDPIRVRPTAFIGSLDNAGQVHIAKELIDNSWDELNNVPYSGIVQIIIFRDRRRKTYQILIADNGRGFPLGKFQASLTKLWVSGKYNQEAYDFSGGSYGLGAKCQAALSTNSKVITLRKEGAGILSLVDGKMVDLKFVDNPTPQYTGTWIIYEPVKSWKAQGNTYEFHEIEYFAQTGFLDLVKIIRVNDIFTENIRFVVGVVDVPLPTKVWDISLTLPDTLEILRNLDQIYTPTIIYDTDSIANRTEYLLEYLGADGPIIWTKEGIDKVKNTEDDRLSFKCKMLLTKSLKKTGMLVLVNNIIMRIESNSPQVVFTRVFNKLISEYIEDQELRKFFLMINYTVPVQVALSIMYGGAQFSGTTKDTFRDKVFEEYFSKELLKALKRIPTDEIKMLVELFLPDLENKYNIFYNKPMKVKDTKKLLLELKNPGNYTACKTTNRSQAELFIVEGTSAGHLKKEINSDFQAIIETRGKPLNAISISEDRRVAFQKLKDNDIFSDLIKIIGITPNTQDMSESNFGKIIITTDADADGEHIVSLYLGNLYVLNPKILESGMVYLATPPLFVMNFKNRKMYLRDKIALYDARIDFIYKNTMDFHISSVAHKEPFKLEGAAYRDFCYLVIQIGEMFDNISNVLNIPPLILERLTYGIDYLIPHVQIDKLRDLFKTTDDSEYVKIVHHPNMNMLVLSLDEQDIPISLAQLGEVIQKHLLPLLIPIKWREFYPMITTKLSDNMKMFPCTLMHIYTAMCNLDKNNTIRIDRYKGLGEMHPEDMRKTIADPGTRTLYRITSLGDVHRIFELMGKDALQRKLLMSESGTVSNDIILSSKCR